MTAVLAWFAVVLLPGAGAVLLLAPRLRRDPVLVLAVGPGIGITLCWTVSWVMSLLDVGPWPWAALVGLLAFAGGATRILVARRADQGREGTTGGPQDGSSGAGTEGSASSRRLLVAAVLLGLSAWILPWAPSVPSTRDVQNHAYFVARISEENSLDPQEVLARSPLRDELAAEFYPLAAHSTMAMARRATGAPVAGLLVTWTVLSAALVLPCGLFSLTRRLVPGRPAAAGWAAVAGALTTLFPYQPMFWGGLALVLGLAAVPGTVALVLTAVGDARSARAGSPSPGVLVLGALAVAGAAFVHTSELFLLALLLATTAAWDAATLPRSRRRACMARWMAVGGLAVMFVAPMVPGLASAAGERGDLEEVVALRPTEAVWRLISFDVDEGPGQAVAGLAALAGVAVLVHRRREEPLGRMAPYLVTTAVLVLLALSLMLEGPPWSLVRVATAPWCRSWWRVPYNLAVLGAVPIGVALEASCAKLRTVGAIARRPGLAAATVVVVAAAVGLPSARGALAQAGVRRELFTPEQLAMFERVSGSDGNGSPGGVLNQENDGTVWLYVIEGVPTYSALQGVGPARVQASRDGLLEELGRPGSLRGVMDELADLGIGWVLLRDNTYHDEPAALTADGLVDTPGVELVERQGSLWLFAITP